MIIIINNYYYWFLFENLELDFMDSIMVVECGNGNDDDDLL